MKKLVTILIGAAFILTIPTRSLAIPVIGGDPIYTQEDYLFADDWGLTLYSYVFDTTSASLPGNMTLDPGEMLFMHLLDADDTKTVSVAHFAVGNPAGVPINQVGWTTDVVPQGYDVGEHQEPYLFGYSGPAQATIYSYFSELVDPFSTLDPGEYSLIYYVAVATDYAPVSATADGGGMSDDELIPGPIPEPATLFLLGLGGLALMIKRRV